MMKLSKKGLFGFICVSVILVIFGFVFKSYFFEEKEVRAETLQNLTDVNDKNALAYCGDFVNGEGTQVDGEVYLRENVFKLNPDDSNENSKITVERGSFVYLGAEFYDKRNDDENRSPIGQPSGLSYNVSGNVVNGNIILDPQHPVNFTYDSGSLDKDIFIKLNFGLNEDAQLSGTNNGCVSVWVKNSIDGDYSKGEGHPYVKGTDGDGQSKVYKTLFLNVEYAVEGGEIEDTEENVYLNTLCADLRNGSCGATNDNHLNCDIVNKYWKSEYVEEYLSKYPNCRSDAYRVNVNLTYDDMRKRLESVITKTFENMTANDIRLPKDSEFNWFNEAKVKEVKDMAENADTVNTHYLIENGDQVSSKTYTLTCNAKAPSIDVNVLNQNGIVSPEDIAAYRQKVFNERFLDYIEDPDTHLSTYNIKANTDYFYASKTTEGEKIYFEPKNTTYLKSGNKYTEEEEEAAKKDLGYCSQTCEESVIVNYGPPIASTGGLCFEYQIQVTSKVQCKTEEHTVDVKLPNVCTPRPHCNNLGQFSTQAGPNDEFEACINKCDGGKYTESCSEKCYNSVYNRISYSMKQSSKSFDDLKASKLVAYDNLSDNWKYWFEGKYVMAENGKITWQSPEGRFTYGSYYRRNATQFNCLTGATWCAIGSHTGNYYNGYSPKYGFKWHYSYGSPCSDSCYWQNNGCTKFDYLNEDDLAEDQKLLDQQKDSASALCSAKASCTEKTANFNISVRYQYYTNDDLIEYEKDHSYELKPTEITVKFPYSTSADSLKSSSSETQCNGNPSAEELKKSSSHSILQYAGCYKNCGDDTLYHTRWSFPGGWESTKSGEYTWKDMSGDSDWKYLPNKFCVPGTILNTNEKFWRYYISNLPDGQVESWGKFVKKNNVDTSYTEEDWNNLDYNIKASATNFGYFGWNFNFRCFYSIEKQGLDTLEYEFKTVDLNDLFATTDGTSKAPDAFSTADDRIPFNWSSKAIQNNGESANLQADPIKYGKYVQTKGYDIYSDEELEYHFHLTPSVMKAFNKTDYKVFSSGKSINHQGVLAYTSALIRSGDLKSATVRAPSEGILGCNNIKNVSDGTTTGKCISVNDLK